MLTVLLTAGSLGLALAADGEPSVVIRVGDPVDLQTGGGWGKAFPQGDGTWWLLSAGDHDYNLFEVQADLSSGPHLRGLTDEIYPCIDHAMAACPDGTYLHVCSGNVEEKDDSGYYFHYDADFEVVDHGVIAERDTDYRYNDAPVLCSEPLRGTVFHPHIESWSPFVTLDGGVSIEDPPFEVNPVPPIPGNALIYEEASDSVLRFGAEFADNTLTIDRFTLGVAQPLERVELEVLEDNWEVYWPQSVLRIGDLYFLAHMAREQDLGWSEDLGNVYLLVLDERFNIVEHHQLTFYEVADIGAMRPFIAVQDDVMILVYDYLIRPFGLNIALDLDQIENGNRVPIARAGPGTGAVVSEPALLDGRASWDPNGDPLTFAWSVTGVPEGSAVTTADLSGGDGELALLFPDVAGDYTLVLTVSDGTESDTDETTVSANDAVDGALSSDGAPVAVALGPDRGVTGAAVALDGSQSSDPDGHSLSARWRFMAVPRGSAVTDADLADAGALSTSFAPDLKGNYELMLMVTDGKRSAVDTVKVKVLGPYLGCASSNRGSAGGLALLCLLLGLLTRRSRPGGPWVDSGPQ